jgi:hypothetical protein
MPDPSAGNATDGPFGAVVPAGPEFFLGKQSDFDSSPIGLSLLRSLHIVAERFLAYPPSASIT